MSKIRRGFTIIELLVVVGIIGLLATITLNVIGDSIDQAREAATATTILKVNELLEKRVEAFNRAMRGAALANAARRAQFEVKAAQTPNWPAQAVLNQELRPLRQRVAEIIGRKIFFRESFPQRFVGDPTTSPPIAAEGIALAELASWPLPGPPAPPASADAFDILNNTVGANNISDAVERVFLKIAQQKLALATPTVTPSAADITAEAISLSSLHTPVTESSEMLYLLLTEFDSYGAPAVGADQFKAGEVADTDGDGLMEFVDGWGNPLRFYRWPTRLLRPATVFSTTAGTTPGPINRGFSGSVMKGLLEAPTPIGGFTPRDQLAVDPDDPIGLVFFEGVRLARGVGGGAPTLNLGAYVNEANLHTLDTFHTPLVVSAGADGNLGLFEPNDYASFGHLAQPNVVAGDELDDNITNRNRRAGGRN